MVLSGTVETSIMDSGATSSFGKQVMSKCRNYALDTSVLVATGLPSNKVFRYAEGNLGVADKIRHLPFDVRGKAREIHMTPGLENHLIPTNRFAEENYVQVFDKEQVNIYDATTLEIKTTRGTVLWGWRVPREGLWQIPLVKGANQSSNQNTDTAAISKAPQQILQSIPSPTRDVINNVYKLTTKPEFVHKILPRGGRFPNY